MKKMKNGILKTLAAIAGTMFVLSVCAMTDTQSFVPEIVSFISLAYLILFGYANGIFKEPEVPVKNEKGTNGSKGAFSSLGDTFGSL